jgi:hypothetical protein
LKCPNGCGETVHLGKPAIVFVDEEILKYVPKDMQDSVPSIHLIDEVCSSCGFHSGRTLSKKQYEKWLEERKLLSGVFKSE